MPFNGPSEKETRKDIDRALESVGWGPFLNFSKGASYDHGSVREYETETGLSDYILFHDGKALAAVEAKREGLGPQGVLNQAQRYARGFKDGDFNSGGYHLPFIYSTNGKIFWFQDLRERFSRSRQVSGFHTPDALLEMLQREETGAEAWLRQTPIDESYLRKYQVDAISSIEEALLAGKRRMLVAMATGTGKTRVAMSLVYRLIKSGLARRILFLVDRRALAVQATGALSTLEPEPGNKFDKLYEVYSQRFRREDLGDLKFDPKTVPPDYLIAPKPQHTFVYVCTIQRMMMNLFGREGMFTSNLGDVDEDDDPDIKDIPIHAFDLIIADECHRGYTSAEESKWREVLDHFDGVKIGLTATPAAHTKAYFKDIVYEYGYETAVQQGYLADYDCIRINSEITMRGVFLEKGEEIGLIDTKTGVKSYDRLEDERKYETSDIERKMTVPDRNRKIVKEFAKYAFQQQEELGHFPKTLVFAINDLPHTSHADIVVEMLRDEFGRGDAFVEKITGRADRPLQMIRTFRNRPEPGIVVTVDMVTTGVDIPPIENLLFLRPVKSRILFEQMMGRGTRKCDAIGKSNFRVFDAIGLLHYFENTGGFTADPPDWPT